MKKIKVFVLMGAMFFSINSEAQFFKKLKKRAEEAAKETVSRKVEEKTAKETEKSFDSVFNNKGRLFKKKKVSPSEYYQFSYKYVMQIQNGKDTTNIDYYLTDDGAYMGSSIPMNSDEQMFNVIDIEKETAYLFMDNGKNKSTLSFNLAFEKEVQEHQAASSIDVSKTGNSKLILGYQCDEYQVKGMDLHGTVWITKEADISFSDAFYRIKTKKFKASKNIDQSWLATIEGLTLEMHMTDTSKKKNRTIHMICTGLEETAFTIDTKLYRKMF